MAGRVQKEIKQKKPFSGIAEEAFVNLQRTAGALIDEVAAALKPAGLTPTQYNVLRILRGARPDGLTCSEIAERMINRDPDITRLLDRMESRNLVSRSREAEDRRIVITHITEEGMRILKDLDEPINNLHRRQFGRLTREQSESLIELLEMTREPST